MSGELTQTAQDLTSCEREPIQIPGSIQPHGVLLVLALSELRIIQASSNTADHFGKSADVLLGLTISEVVSSRSLKQVQDVVASIKREGREGYLEAVEIQGSATQFEGSVHRNGDVLLLQLEPGPTPDGKLILSAREAVDDLHQARSVDEFCDLAAQAVRKSTGYDRVMVYRFLEDNSGEVIGESKRPDKQSLLGLRYPESDIPRQARELYRKSWLRIIADVHAVPAAMVPALNPETNAPLDMSFCVLRSVSPIHIQYMKNMGVQASMSLSLIHEEKLWGLIACHHDMPKQLSQEARIACEFLAHVFSLQIGAKEDREQRLYATRLRSDVERLSKQLSAEKPLHEALLDHRPNILSLFRASGVAVVTAAGVYFRGVTPDESALRPLLDWLRLQSFPNGVFATNQLPVICPVSEPCSKQASGLLAIQVEDEQLRWLLWFRQEVTQVVNWAGNPHKPVEVDDQGVRQLSPRHSFALWQEEKRGLSEPWASEEVAVAVELRRAVMEVVAHKVHQMAVDKRDLTRSNGELEAFAYAAAHDLRAPLRGIRYFTEMVLNSTDGRLDTEEYQHLKRTLELSQRMDGLIDSLLEFSRVGQLELVLRQVNLDELVAGVISMLKPLLESCSVVVRVPRSLGTIFCDQVRSRELFQNLIANASKYNDKAEKWIEIGFEDRQPRVFYVRDNGIGIEERHHESIFRLFRRLHGQNEYGGGTGAGLTIAKRIVERHGGVIRLDSKPGEGSTFYFTLEPTE